MLFECFRVRASGSEEGHVHRFLSPSLKKTAATSYYIGDSVSFSALATIKALSGPAAELDRFNFFQVSENQSFAAAALLRCRLQVWAS